MITPPLRPYTVIAMVWGPGAFMSTKPFIPSSNMLNIMIASAIAGEWCGTCNRLNVAVNAARIAVKDADANRTESR